MREMPTPEYDRYDYGNEDTDGHRRGRGIFWCVLLGVALWIAIIAFSAWLVS
jgi:hypothetical protein